MLGADRLDHLDRDELVEAALEVAVVAAEHGHAIAEAGGGDALARQRALLRRDGGARHAAAVAAGGVEAEAAPAGPDLEHVVLGAQGELAADAVVLG